MARVVGVHGIGQYRYHRDPKALAEQWRAALGGALSCPEDFALVYYSPLLHSVTAQGHSAFNDLTPTEQSLLESWLMEVGMPDAVAQGPLTSWLRDGVDWLVRNERLGGATSGLVRAALAEVAAYTSAARQDRRLDVQEQLATVIRAERPEVVIAHSLGSVVAYETLWANPDLAVPLLVTLGSPLALPGVFYREFVPSEARSHSCPPGVSRWANFADAGDLVAVPKQLSQFFSGIDEDETVTIDAFRCHTVLDYIACPSVSRAVRSGSTPGIAGKWLA